MIAKDIMTSHVVSITPDSTVDQAIKVMLERHLSGLPVVDDKGRLVGILTEGDLLRRQEIGTERHRPRWLEFFTSLGKMAVEYAHARGRKVDEVMTADVITATEESKLEDIVELMMRHGVKRIPIVYGGGPIGIVSRADVLRALQRKLSPKPEVTDRTDDDILRDIRGAFEHSRCITPILIDLSVHNGKVVLRGAIQDERERGAIHVAVENVPGVKAVEDHLTWVAPLSGMVLLSPEDEAPSNRTRGMG